MIKNIKFNHPNEYFSHHPHFQRQEFFFPRYNHALSLCFHSRYIEYKNFTHDILIHLLSLLFNRINGGWWWWIVFMVWLTDESVWPYFHPGPLSEILTITNLRHAASKVMKWYGNSLAVRWNLQNNKVLVLYILLISII